MVASPGYNIPCDPGAVGMQTCYTTDPTPGAKQEIIGYTAGGDPISKGASSSSWMAWVPTLTTLNQQGTAYQPYGEAGIPYTLGGGSLIKWMMSGGADPQDVAYLEQAPGAFSRKMYDERTCDPLWPTLGCKTAPTDNTGLQTAPTEEESAQAKSTWSKFLDWVSGGESKAAEGESKLPVIVFGVGVVVVGGWFAISALQWFGATKPKGR